jgi:tRNA(fMet)-specific endonuclease VapC
MSGRYLLDTNILIALFANESAVTDHLREAEEVFVPSIALGELYYGARKSSHVGENIARINDLATNSAVLGCDTKTAQQYGEIKNRLRQKGHPIPENDIWIAAIATQNDLTLVARDAHFKEVDELEIEAW